MANALDAFRAQREATEQVHARLVDVADLLRSLRQEMASLAHDQALRELLRDEQTWLHRAESLVDRVQRFRQSEMSRFWPAVWRRWAMAMALALVTGAGIGASYIWTDRPYVRELDQLKSRVELMDFVAQRVIRMTPAERREFDALMKWNEPAKK